MAPWGGRLCLPALMVQGMTQLPFPLSVPQIKIRVQEEPESRFLWVLGGSTLVPCFYNLLYELSPVK